MLKGENTESANPMTQKAQEVRSHCVVASKDVFAHSEQNCMLFPSSTAFECMQNKYLTLVLLQMEDNIPQ